MPRCVMRRILMPVLAAVALVGSFASPAQAASPVHFGVIQYDSPGSDDGSNASLNAEYVRIRNASATTAVRLTGWTVRDAQAHVYKFGTFTLGAGKTVTLHTGSGSNTATDVYWRSGAYIWNNTGDKAILKNANGVVVDTCAWGAGPGQITC